MVQRLSDLYIVPDYDNSKIVTSFTTPEGCTKAMWEVLDQRKVILNGHLDIKPGQKTDFDTAIENFIPWNVNNPHLYTLKLILSIDSKLVEISKNFGMRKIHVSNNVIYVNNEKFYLRGYVRGREAHDHPNLENLPLEEFYAKNICAAKRYGFNFVRFHSCVPPEECFRAADRLGIFIHIEIRPYFGQYQKERKSLDDQGGLIDEEKWKEAILRLRNHASLMVYCIGNEIRHPGSNPQVEKLAHITRELDPTRLFLDTCAHGEFDRTYVDIDVQHMTYYYPFAKDYDMFENTQNWLIFGSCKGQTLVESDGEDNDFTYRVSRTLIPHRPIIAHEVCHYVALRDLDALDEKFKNAGVEKPWWIDELKKLVRLKKLEKDYPLMMEASKKFQFLSWKLAIEGARRSRILNGFHYLQLSDTERYENSNGILDCFDDSKGVDEKEFLKFNGDTVLLADLPRRTYFEGEQVTIPVLISHFSPITNGMADFSFRVESRDNSVVSINGSLKKINLDELGLREICHMTINFPRIEKPEALRLICCLTAIDGSYKIDNDWNLWLYPDRAEEFPSMNCTVLLDEINLNRRYNQIESRSSLENPEKLLIVNKFSEPVLRHLKNGCDVLMLYRVPVTRDRKIPAEKEKYYLPATWDRFKGVIWDRGTNCGAFIQKSRATDWFPNDGFMDLQFHGLIDDCDKIILDDFPCEVKPIMQGVDKAVRDRYDVFTFGLSELQPDRTIRKFAYIFELNVGKGRLFITGLNFTGLNTEKPETCAMFESILRYVTSDAFKPKASISVQEFENYLLKKGAGPIVKERRMTQFWQLDEEPLESKRYRKKSLEYLGEKPVVPDQLK